MPEWGAALLGVVIGFSLNEISTIFKNKSHIKKYRTALLDELNTVLAQISQKEDIANQMITALNENKFLSGHSVPFASTIYVHYFPSIIHAFTSIERDNIRHIFSNLELLDNVMNTLETEYKKDINSTAMDNINSAYIGKLKDVIESYSTLNKIITELLSNNPIDIYYRKK